MTKAIILSVAVLRKVLHHVMEVHKKEVLKKVAAVQRKF